MKNIQIVTLGIVTTLAFTARLPCNAQAVATDTKNGQAIEADSLAFRLERDEIAMLGVYASLNQSFQDEAKKKDGSRRGHNIAAVLVDSNGKILSLGKNTAYITGDRTQHAEVRAIQSHLSSQKTKYVSGCTIYTTLEPCPMCSGMMVMTDLGRVVYGQSDEAYGDGLRRLRGYPWEPVASQSQDYITRLLAASFDDFRSETPDAIVVDYLYTEKARNVLSLAKLKLDTFEVLFAENNNFLEDVRKMVSTAGE